MGWGQRKGDAVDDQFPPSMANRKLQFDSLTLLRMPIWLGIDVFEKRALPLALGDYKGLQAKNVGR